MDEDPGGIVMRDPERCWWQRERAEVLAKLGDLQKTVQDTREALRVVAVKTGLFATFGAILGAAVASAVAHQIGRHLAGGP